MKNIKSIIIPICIYHYIDPETSTYMGYIGNPRKIKINNGKEIYQCPSEPLTFRKWFRAGVFYAVSPSFRPIPIGMRIFCAKRMESYPYATTDMTAMYDTYNIKNECVYFTTYNQPVPNTQKLYFHTMGKYLFPSFDPKPPSNDQKWKQTKNSPIFVMTPQTVGNLFPDNDQQEKSEQKKLNFKCVNGSCLPWVKDIKDIYDVDPYDDLLDLEECVLFCNELVPSPNKGRPFDLIQLITTGSQKKPIVSRFFKKLPSWIIALCISSFLLLLFIVLYILFSKNDILKHNKKN